MTDLDAVMAQRKLNSVATSMDTPVVFLGKHPTLKREKAHKLFLRYLETVASALLTKLPFLQDGETYISTDALLTKCGDFKVNGKRFYTFNEFRDIYPLFRVIAKGSNLKSTTNPFEKNSRIKVVNERFLTMLLEEKSPTSVFNHFYDLVELDSPDVGAVPIDMDNLLRYIGNTEIELETATETKHRAKLQGNLWQARIVHKIGAFCIENDGEPVLPLVPSKSPYGRTYYKGMNIQNVSKNVRSAIIGHHYQYDMNAAVFATKLSMYGQIMGGDNVIANTTFGSYTRQYLAEKKLIRERLAKHCFDGIALSREGSIKAIKNALTAIGFGARTTGKTWLEDGELKGTSLSEILIAPDARHRFLADPWVKAFLAEQHDIEEAILKSAETWPSYDQMCKDVAAANGANGKATRAGKLAWIYQHEETNLMDAAVAVLATFNISPVARIHDAFVVKEKLSQHVMDEISVAWGLKPYLSLDREEVRDWIDPAFKRALLKADTDRAAHRQHIEREEATAQKKAALKRAGW